MPSRWWSGKARSRAAAKPDRDGLAFLTESWTAALAAGAFLAPPGTGGVARPDPSDPAAAATALQTASAVEWGEPAPGAALGALSLEAARLSLPQTAPPGVLANAQAAFLADADLSPGLRAALEALTEAAG